MRTTDSKMIIYSVLPRLFGNRCETLVPNGSLETNGCGKLADFSTNYLRRLRASGCTHIWPIGLIRHATQTGYDHIGLYPNHRATTKGRAGSPYAITDYYDIAPDLAVDPAMRMTEFDDFVTRIHHSDLKLIIDFVPNHTARRYKSIAKPSMVEDFGEYDDKAVAFAPHNNYYYLPDCPLIFDHGDCEEAFHYSEMPAKVTGNDCFSPRPARDDWYDTAKLNYGIDIQSGGMTHFDPIPDTWYKMLHILLYWCNKGVDGFRCDMAQMVPVAFWQWIIPQIKADRPHIAFIAEIYVPEQYEAYLNAGFDYLYDKVGMYDTMRAVITRKTSAHHIHTAYEAIAPIAHHMISFMENHDEQRIASDFFGADTHAGLLASAVSGLISPGPFLIYFGQSVGEVGMDAEGYSGLDGRTTIFDYWSVASIRRLTSDGSFDGTNLLLDEFALYEASTKILSIAVSEPLVVSGHYYYLGNDNNGRPGFDNSCLFAFVRHDAHGSFLLVLANFADAPIDTSIRLTQHFLNTVGVQASQVCRCSDLITERISPADLLEEAPLYFSLPPFGLIVQRYEPLFLGMM